MSFCFYFVYIFYRGIEGAAIKVMVNCAIKYVVTYFYCVPWPSSEEVDAILVVVLNTTPHPVALGCCVLVPGALGSACVACVLLVGRIPVGVAIRYVFFFEDFPFAPPVVWLSSGVLGRRIRLCQECFHLL